MSETEMEFPADGGTTCSSSDVSGIPSKDESDEMLFARFVNDECERSFNIIYTRHEPRIRGFILGRIGDPSITEDLTQNVFMRITRAKHSYDSAQGEFSTWCHTIANNCLKNHYRTVSRNRMQNFSDLTLRGSLRTRNAADPIYDAPCPNRTPDQEAYLSELREQLDEKFAALPQRNRDPFVQHQVDGLTFDLIAESIGIPVGTVKSRAHKARSLLRTKMNIYADE